MIIVYNKKSGEVTRWGYWDFDPDSICSEKEDWVRIPIYPKPDEKND